MFYLEKHSIGLLMHGTTSTTNTPASNPNNSSIFGRGRSVAAREHSKVSEKTAKLVPHPEIQS